MIKTEIIEINDDLGIILPEEILQSLNLRIGDDIVLTENANSLTIKPLENKNIAD